MRKHKFALALILAIGAGAALAQNISVEETEMLEKLRAEALTKGFQLTPEVEVRTLMRFRAFKALAADPAGPATVTQLLKQQLTGKTVVDTPSVATARAAPASAAIAESDLRNQLDTLPPGKQLGSFEMLRDGLKFNGQRFADPEGVAERFALDPESATAAYIVQMGAVATVKIARIGTASSAVAIGRISKDGNRQVFESLTGKILSGDLFFPLTDGALLVRDSVGFRYVVGEGVRQLDFPAGWSPAPLQRGSISATGWMLLERDTSEQKNDPLSLFKYIGEKTGASPPRMDYALFNLADSRMVPFEISTDGKNVATYAQCRRKNTFVNVCDQMKTFESVWNANGSPNLTHYYWLVDWQRSNGKPVAVAMEKTLRQVNGYDLSGTKRVNLFERMMGINGYRMELAGEGKYRVTARLAFETGIIDDVMAEVQNRADVPRTP